MAVVGNEVLQAMLGAPIADTARDYYFLTSSDIAATETTIREALATQVPGWKVGTFGVFPDQQSFDAAFEPPRDSRRLHFL